MELAGKVAIITGAGSGIGLATARLFAEAGAQVVAADVSERGLAQFDATSAIDSVVADVAKPADVDRMIQATTERHGRLDILCNNAGIVDRMLPVAEMPDDVWQHVLAVNLTGPFLVCRRAIPHMLRQGSGVIINIASVGGLVGARAGAAYTASKHGLIGLTQNIAATYGADGIRCVAICPGGVNTGISLGGEPSVRGMAALQRTLPASLRIAEPEEIARVALFLASDAASLVNGAALVADGGWLAHQSAAITDALVPPYMIEHALVAPSVREWVKTPYRAIAADERDHADYPARAIARYATDAAAQERVRRAVAMSLTLRQQYFADLDDWVLHDRTW